MKLYLRPNQISNLNNSLLTMHTLEGSQWRADHALQFTWYQLSWPSLLVSDFLLSSIGFPFFLILWDWNFTCQLPRFCFVFSIRSCSHVSPSVPHTVAPGAPCESWFPSWPPRLHLPGRFTGWVGVPFQELKPTISQCCLLFQFL